MTQNASLPSAQQLKVLLDNDPVAIFVSDIESRRVLYANRQTRDTLLQDVKDACCYHLAGFQEPCPFCH